MAEITLPEPGDLDWAEPLNEGLMQIAGQTVVNGTVDSNGMLILQTAQGDNYEAGIVRGEPGEPGPPGPPGGGSVSTVNGDPGPDIVLGPSDIGGSTSPTSGTIPIRGAGGTLPGIGAPVDIGDAATKAYVDSGVSSALAQLPARFTEGVPYYSYGHSYTMVPSPYTTPTGGEYPVKLGKRLRAARSFYRGRSGTPGMDTWCLALSQTFTDGSSVNRTWTPGSMGVVTLQNWINEAVRADGGNSLFQGMWMRSIRSLLALMSSSSVITASSGVRRGTWTKYTSTPNVPSFANEDAYFSNSAGAEIDFTTSGDEVWIIAAASSSTYPLSDFQVRCGGQLLRTVSTSGTNISYTSTVMPDHAVSWWPCAYKVTGLNAAAGTTGGKTVTIRATTATTMFINGIMIPSIKPPQIFMAQEPTRNPGATSGNAAFVANRGAYQTMTAQLAAEFPNVHVVNLDQGWDNSKFVASLDTTHKFHPNDAGMNKIADIFEAEIKAKITAPINGVMVL